MGAFTGSVFSSASVCIWRLWDSALVSLPVPVCSAIQALSPASAAVRYSRTRQPSCPS